jgi:hypothetical protein
MQFLFIILAALMALAGCELPGEPPGGGAGLVVLLPGAGGGAGRAIGDPGNIGHDSVQRLLTYEITLSGPGGRTVTRSAGYGETLHFDLAGGTWTITTNAFFRDRKQANDPASGDPAAQPKTVNLAPGVTQSVPVTLELAPWLKNAALIPDAATFKKIGDPPASGGWYGEEKTFLLLADLVLDNWEGPKIQGASSSNRAIFEGNGHTVTINSFAAGAGNYGLFTDAYRADISGLNIVLDIGDGDNTEINAGAGGVTPIGSDVNIKGVHVSGTLHVTTNSGYTGNSFAGGIAGGLSSGDVISCSSKLDLKLSYTGAGNGSAGGLVGELGDTTPMAIIYDSFFNGTVDGPISGGIIGKTGGSSAVTGIKNCYSVGIVKGTKSIGGIAGIFDGPSGSTITGCYSSATVMGEGSGGYAGGIVGSIASGSGFDIEDCLALNPAVTGTSGWARAYPVYGTLSGTGTLTNKSIGMTIECSNNPNDGGATGPSTSSGDIITLSNPPEQTDFPSPAFYFDPSSPESFAMPPPGWGIYPVFQWQIEQGIKP